MEIITASYLTSSPSIQQCPPADRPEYAFIGRSNVGKSSLINMIANNAKLAKTSGTPGKTQLINHFNFSSRLSENAPEQHWYVVDLPGYGFAKRSQSMRSQWERMIQNYLLQRKSLAQVFLLIDSRHTPQKSDLDFADNLYSNNIPYTILFTKSDKENQREVSKNVNAFTNELKVQQQWLPAMIVTSSVKKSGRKKILQRIAELNETFQN